MFWILLQPNVMWVDMYLKYVTRSVSYQHTTIHLGMQSSDCGQYTKGTLLQRMHPDGCHSIPARQEQIWSRRNAPIHTWNIPPCPLAFSCKVELLITWAENVTYLACDTDMGWDDCQIITEKMTQLRGEVICARINKNVKHMMVTVALINSNLVLVQPHVLSLLNDGVAECLPSWPSCVAGIGWYQTTKQLGRGYLVGVWDHVKKILALGEHLKCHLLPIA